MKLRHLKIERFRGIKELDWKVGSPFVCLIGPGDSTKTTILDAIDLALSPRWNLSFDDTDFYELKVDEPFSIIVTIGNLPDELKSDAKYGLVARGWNLTEGLHDEPQDGDELVLSIRLKVDSSLEPSWTVFNEREPEGLPIGAKDRERFGCARLGEYLDRHFAWGRGSILSKLTEEKDSLSGILAEANRAAKATIVNDQDKGLSKLRTAAKRAKEAGARLGIAPKHAYQPNLDFKAVTIGEGGLSLHDGNVPVRRTGLGSRRLLAMAMQREVSEDGGLILIDEIEHGLEPHRIRRLLQVLTEPSESGEHRSVLMTSHAPIAIQELKAEQLRVVHSEDGITKIIAIPVDLQRIIIKTSEALLARKIIVCEGKTEIGFCRRLDKYWAKKGRSFGLEGIALANGGGTGAPSVAVALRRLGYGVAFLGDSDVAICPTKEKLEMDGIHTFIWEGDVSIEQRLSNDLPWEGVARIIELAILERGEQSVQDTIKNYLGEQKIILQGDPIEWNKQMEEKELRKAMGIAAKEAGKSSKGWFKRIDLGEELASIVLDYYHDQLINTDLERKINGLYMWAYGIS